MRLVGNIFLLNIEDDIFHYTILTSPNNAPRNIVPTAKIKYEPQVGSP